MVVKAHWEARRQALQQLTSFLQKNGFKDQHSSRGWLLRATRPLHEASRQNDAAACAVLLAAGADPTATDGLGRRAVALASAASVREVFAQHARRAARPNGSRLGDL